MGYHSLMAARKDISSYPMEYYNQERPHAFNDLRRAFCTPYIKGFPYKSRFYRLIVS